MKTFPKTIVVKIDSDDDSSWLHADTKITNLIDTGDSVRVGIYTLTEVIQADGVVTTKRLKR